MTQNNNRDSIEELVEQLMKKPTANLPYLAPEKRI